MRPQRVEQARLAELLVAIVERLGDAVGVDRQQIAGQQAGVRRCSIPNRETVPARTTSR